MGRPVRGSRLSSFYTVEPNPSLANLDSAFQLQEYISLLVRLDPHDVQRIVALPGKKDLAGTSDQPQSPQPDEERPVVDEACWIYEQLRRLAQDLTHPLITTLQQECTRQTCPEMKAGEWLYLCVAHGNSGGMEHCCAIDYIVHTLDSATALLNSPRAFPSRISIPTISHRHFPSLARRLGRIFAHAYHHHRAAFETAEAEGALYARFLALARRFDLVPPEFLVIPPRPTDAYDDTSNQQRVTLLTRETESSLAGSPRIGGRARTDTMYLSGGFPGTTDHPSPRRMPSPLADTPFGEHADEAAVPDTNRDVRAPEKSKVYARDFALPPELNKKLLEQDPGAESSTSEEQTAQQKDNLGEEKEEQEDCAEEEAPTKSGVEQDIIVEGGQGQEVASPSDITPEPDPELETREVAPEDPGTGDASSGGSPSDDATDVPSLTSSEPPATPEAAVTLEASGPIETHGRGESELGDDDASDKSKTVTATESAQASRGDSESEPDIVSADAPESEGEGGPSKN